ncbi:type IV conjugative transfer system pilin TraA [Escherichia coli]|uniref:type IV conjugative transfer system pilin TraA n=1 Tax=Escherichia coli TaxID=562 RepID=UPI001E4ECB64|nr:type IV conjugative transfer system pilin TraA [Escherichia coli]MCD9303476.1 type IV conjugative transfer system pilin TraA [Escherichia coli]
MSRVNEQPTKFFTQNPVKNFAFCPGQVRQAVAVMPLAAKVLKQVMVNSSSGQDLMASGNNTVKATFGKDSSIVKWVVLAEVLVGAVMYMMTKNVKFLAGFAIISVFIAVGMAVVGL